MSGTRDENVYMARLAEQAERYEDMVTYMTRVASMGTEMTLEERNLFSVAFKNVVGARRVSWRSIAGMMQKEDPNEPYLPHVNDYKNQVEAELKAKCEEVLRVLSKADGLIPTATNYEAQAFYMKMEGDYYRYLAEFSSGAEQAQFAQSAYDAYSRASEVANQLPPTHPIRLGLALNFSVFYYEVYGKAREACNLAKASFEAACAEFSSLPEGQAQDSQAILQLLRDNLELWQADLNKDGQAQVEDGTQCEDL